jgi:nitrate reductase gamma subunit
MPQHQSSSLLATVEVIHWIALAFMVVVYTVRLFWLFRYNRAVDRSAPGNPDRTNAAWGGLYSLGNVVMPWAMESTRSPRGFTFYLSFVLFHLGVVAGITLAFVSSLYRPVLEVPGVAYVVGVTLAAASLVALYRIARRFGRPVMRLISTPDDYFSLIMLTVWFLLGVFAQAHIAGAALFTSEAYLVAFLIATSFFLVYVPFSKISHYLYYPFTRYWLGRALGQRGSYPYPRTAQRTS